MGENTFTKPLYLLMLLLLAGCYPEIEQHRQEPVMGYRPVYGTATSSEILMAAARRVEDPGKIYLYGKYLLVNEKKQGIHVFDNSNAAEPVNIGFIQLLGNTDMAIKDGLLYADHLGNLVSLTLNDFTTIEENGRLPLRNWNLGLPPPRGFHFECVDPAKGLVVSWKSVELKNAQCYANN